MKQVRKLNISVACIICFWTFISIVSPVEGCDSFVIKGSGTADGSIIMCALYEWKYDSFPIIHVDRQTYLPGTTVRLSDRIIPQVAQTYAYNYIYAEYHGLKIPLVSHAVNEFGVAIGSTSICNGHVDSTKYRSDGVDFPDCNRIVAERARTAEEGVNIIGQLIETYSYTSTPQDGDSGQEFVIADPSDAWIVECIGCFWLARRITEDFFNCTNALTITNSWDKGTGTAAIDYAIKRGWCTSASDFNWTRFADPLDGAPDRYKAIRRYLTNASRWGHITPRTIMDMLRTKGVGDINSIPTSQVTTIAHLRSGVPDILKNKAWIQVRASAWYDKLFIPLYTWQGVGIPAELGLPKLEYWNSSADTLSPGMWEDYEDWAESATKHMENQVIDKLNQNKTAEALQLLKEFNNQAGEQAWGMYKGVPLPLSYEMPASSSNVASASPSCNALVLVNSTSADYLNYIHYLKPYLDQFGIPYKVIDLKTIPYNSVNFNNYSVIIPGHNVILNDTDYPAYVNQLAEAIHNGVGICSFDARMFDFKSKLAVISSTASQYVNSLTVTNNSHYITDYHDVNESIGLKTFWTVTQRSRLINSTPLVYAGASVLLEAGTYGRGKMVRWNSSGWMKYSIKGPVFGMDDLVWKGIVWAARKPFVMQGMPPLITVQVDDTNGNMSSGGTPYYWIGVFNKYGWKPYADLFIDDMNATAIASIKQYVLNGNATVFSQAFSYNSFIYYPNPETKPFSDAQVKINCDRVKNWYTANGIPMSKWATFHFDAWGHNCIQYLLDWGCEFISVINKGDVPRNKATWLQAGPYKLYDGYSASDEENYPLYYEDWLQVVGCPDLSNRLFQCYVEIRDIAGYEWAPNNDIAGSISRGVKWLKRCMNSMVQAKLLTHESDYIQYIIPENFDPIVKGVTEGIACYNPIYVTIDEQCKYIRAKHNLKLAEVTNKGNNVTISYYGNNDMETKCYKFTEHNGIISSALVNIPQSNGRGSVNR